MADMIGDVNPEGYKICWRANPVDPGEIEHRVNLDGRRKKEQRRVESEK